MRTDVDHGSIGFVLLLICANASHSTGLIYDIDCLIGQFPLGYELSGKLNCYFERFIAVAHIMVFFVFWAKPLKYFYSLLNCGFYYIDLLKASGERTVFFKDLVILLVGRGPDTSQISRSEGRL